MRPVILNNFRNISSVKHDRFGFCRQRKQNESECDHCFHRNLLTSKFASTVSVACGASNKILSAADIATPMIRSGIQMESVFTMNFMGSPARLGPKDSEA